MIVKSEMVNLRAAWHSSRTTLIVGGLAARARPMVCKISRPNYLGDCSTFIAATSWAGKSA